MSTEVSAGPGSRQLSRAFVVSVGSTGVTIPAMGTEPALPVGARELALLSALAAGQPVAELRSRAVASFGLDPARVDAALDLLDRRDLLLPSDGAGSPRGGPGEMVEVAEPEVSAVAPGPQDMVALQVPLLLRLADDGRYEGLDHDGRIRLRLDAAEVAALGELGTPRPFAEAYERHSSADAENHLDAATYGLLIGRVIGAGLARVLEPGEHPILESERRERIWAVEQAALTRCVEAISSRVGAHLAESNETGGDGAPATKRTRVVPIHVNHTIPPTALGLIFAYAKAYKDGKLEEHYDFVPSWMLAPGQLPFLVAEPSVVLVSNYVWSHPECLRLSARVKEVSPHSVVVHGGPNTPKYEADVEAYFRAHPHVDVTVRGEGEATTAELLEALVGRLGDGPADLSVLADVAGISYRDGDRIVRTPDRERIADLDTIPSPFLTGLFDGYAQAALEGSLFQTTIETSRGCPYGCTFCDWGSATNTRLRKFDLDRVFAELEWCAQNRAFALAIADSNFGMLPRDVEVAEKLAELKDRYGYPKKVAPSFAKSSVKNRKAIIEVLTKAGIMAEGLVSLQSLDDGTLAAVERTNIKVDKYDDLATQFRRAGLPLWVELMLGLPGSTVESFANDLQDCIAREVPVKLYMTSMLVNSPMNDPAYKERWKIETKESRANSETLVISTSTYTRQDRETMLDLRRDYLLYENLGILRQVSRYLHQEAGIREVDFYRRLGEAANEDPERFPSVALANRIVVNSMAVPVSWRLFIDEVAEFATEELGVPDDDALHTVLRVQHALLPARGRSFPLRLELPHDFATWHRLMLEAKESGFRQGWADRVPRLRELPPGEMVVDDPHDVSNKGLGASLEQIMDDTWDLESPVSRVYHLRPIPVPD